MEITDRSLPLEQSCAGCSACMNICTADAIEMRAHNDGFLQPYIDTYKCVQCGRCTEICPVLTFKISDNETHKEPECYAAYSKNENIRFESTSGGVFTHLAEFVLKQNGAVVGARYREDHSVEHAVIYSEDKIAELRQSKYVQSETGLILRKTEELLKSGRTVLFSGTPCQCAGLKSYLGMNYPNLYICDFICRGVNSPKVYSEYLDELEKQYGSKIRSVWFKNKSISWNKFGTKIFFDNGKEYFADRETDPYMLGYIKTGKTLNLRKCCYECKFKGVSRAWSDITLGDFWGIDKISKIDVKYGVSAVVIQTQKGKCLFNNIIDSIIVEKHYTNDVIKYNPCICNSVSFTK